VGISLPVIVRKVKFDEHKMFHKRLAFLDK